VSVGGCGGGVCVCWGVCVLVGVGFSIAVAAASLHSFACSRALRFEINEKIL